MQAELNHLEREVEQARDRFTADLARLRSPSIYADFKDDVLAEVRQTKDELVGKATQAARDSGNRVLTEVKDRVAANPAAALAIGAGLAWHLARHPPITSLLVGIGVMSLWRTNPREPSAGAEMVSRATELVGTMKNKAEEWKASETAGRAAEVAESAKTKLTQLASDAGDTSRQAMSQLAVTAQSLTEHGARLVHDREERDKYLLGAAAVAVAAAIGISLQRRIS